MPDRPTCQDCRFWDAFESPASRGYCRINPPVLDHEGMSGWPVCEEGDWCGEHEPHGVNVTIPRGMKDAHKAMYNNLLENVTLATKGKVS